MNIVVQLPSGATVDIVTKGASLESLKKDIENQTTIPAACQELRHDGARIEKLPATDRLKLELVVRIGNLYAIASTQLEANLDIETFHPAACIEGSRDFEWFESASQRIFFCSNRQLEKTTDISAARAKAETRLRPYRQHARDRRARLKDLCAKLGAETVVAMTFNAPYARLFENWHRSCLDNGIDVRNATIAFPMDTAAATVAERLGYVTFHDPESYGTFEQRQEVRFGDRQWIDCLFMKNAVMGDILDTGVDVLFQDVDIVWRRNPIPRLRAKAQTERWDFMFQRDAFNPIFQPLHYNSGFVYARSNDFSRLAWHRILENHRFCYVYQSQQAPVNIVMNVLRERGLRTCVLDDELYVNGHLVPVQPEAGTVLHPEAHIIHFNWTDGLATKLDRLRDNGVWYLDGCDAQTREPQASGTTPRPESPHADHAQCHVSDRYRCIFLAIAKNASTTISSELRRVDPDTEPRRCEQIAPELWRDYTTFVFLRDPVARALSAYEEVSMRLEGKPDDDLPFAALAPGLERFDAFLDHVESNAWDVHVRRQIDLIGDHRIDFWGRVENLPADMARLFELLSIAPTPTLPQHNSRAHRARRAGDNKHFLDAGKVPTETVARIRQIYQPDIELIKSLPPMADAHDSWTAPLVRQISRQG